MSDILKSICVINKSSTNALSSLMLENYEFSKVRLLEVHEWLISYQENVANDAEYSVLSAIDNGDSTKIYIYTNIAKTSTLSGMENNWIPITGISYNISRIFY